MISIERDEPLLNKRMKKLIKKKQNARVKSIIGGANPSILKDFRGSTLLHLAVFYNNTELVEYSIGAGCNVDAQDILKNTPLMIAITKQNYDSIKCLIDANADIFLSNQENQCPLYIILEDLINVPLKVFAWFLNVMESSDRVEDIAEIFIESKCKLNNIVLMQNPEWTRAVLERLETIDDTESLDSVQKALDLMDVPSLEVLLHYGHNVRIRCNQFFDNLLEITMRRDLHVEETLIQNVGYWKVWGTDLYAVRITGRLFQTAELDAVKIFIRHDLHLRIKKGFNVDLMAHCAGNPDPGVIELLRQYLINNCKIPPVGTYNCSVLHFAVYQGVMEIVDTYLVKLGMDPDLQDCYGRTPLFYACCSGNNVELKRREEIVFKLLFYQRADPQILDDYGRSILDKYHREKDWPVIQIVLQFLCCIENHQPLKEVIRTTINSNVQLNEYYEKCRKQLQDMKKYTFCGKVTIYSLRMQQLTITAVSARNNAEIELHDRENVLKWDYYYRHSLCRSIDIIKNINIVKDMIASILYECLGPLRFNDLIITKIVDYFTYDDLFYFNSLSSSNQ